jgi:hypothetical protein
MGQSFPLRPATTLQVFPSPSVYLKQIQQSRTAPQSMALNRL